MFLSILIPTYNRASFLLKNLDQLSSFIILANRCSDIELIISNNCSTDKTNELVEEFVQKKTEIKIQYYQQEYNIGLEKNALFVLEKSNADYVMYLGDDDYLDFKYFEGVLKHLLEYSNTHCIIPNFVPIDIQGIVIGNGRDDKHASKIYKKGFNNCLINSYRGHQLSGITLKRERLLNSYHKNKVNNIYLFIYFVAYSCLNGDTYLFTDYPVKVTQPGQENKDWRYGNDGLINEAFDNYIKLPLSILKKTKLQIKLLNKGKASMIFGYYRTRGGNKMALEALFNMWFCENATFLYKICYPFIIVILVMKIMLRKIIRFLCQ